MITAIMTGYRRPHTLEEQRDAILAQSVKANDIWLWYNKSELLQKHIDGVTGIYCDTNFKIFSRFALALLVKTEYVAIFDDDTIPGKDWFKSCLQTMETSPGILGCTGVKLKSDAGYVPHEKFGWNGQKNTGIVEVDLVGHAWFFKREWLQYLWRDLPVSWDNGEDIHFSACAYKYGGIKTFVPPHPPDNLNVWGSNPTQGMKHGCDSAAIWHNPVHLVDRNKIVIEHVRRGWKPLCRR